MAESPSRMLSEEVQKVRRVLHGPYATDLRGLETQMRHLGAALAEMLLKGVASLEQGQQELRHHLKVTVDTLLEQAEELEQLKSLEEALLGELPAAFPWQKGTAPAGAAAPLSSETVARLEALEQEIEKVRGLLHDLEQRLAAAVASARGQHEELLNRLADQLYLLVLAQARKVAEARESRAASLASFADAIEQVFVPRVGAFRQELSGDVAAYDGCTAIEVRAREVCEDLRRDAERIQRAAAADAERLTASPETIEERLEWARHFLALAGIGETGDALDYELRRALNQGVVALLDLVEEYRAGAAGAARDAFSSLLDTLVAAGAVVGLERIAPTAGGLFEPLWHEADGANPQPGARIACLEAPGYRACCGVLRRARVRLAV